jgi:hypothetical protein
MTRPHAPGTVLLKIAPFVFSEHFVSSVVQPTIADLQLEALMAGPSRIKRLRAQCRGYYAFWALLLVAPFASWAAPARYLSGVTASRVVIGSMIIVAVTVPALGTWVAVVAGLGAVVAILIHAWYERHPSHIPSPSDPPSSRSPQINFSSTQVGGNIGGLIFVVGSIVIVSLGLPSVFWFLVAVIVAASFLAWALAAWHTRHPQKGSPESRIVWR